MSRTYRERKVAVCSTCLRPYWCAITLEYGEDICDCREKQSHYATRACHTKIMKVRDSKPWDKPPRWFKQMRRQRERAQVKQALHNRVYKGEDFTPPVLNRNGDRWDWT